MPETKFYRQESLIPKGSKEGRPVFTRGASLKLVGLPTDRNGKVEMTGTVLGFEGSFDGSSWFSILDYRGLAIGLVVKASQFVVPAGSGPKTSPAILPVRDGVLFEGIQMVRPVSNLAEAEDRLLELHIGL